MGNDLLRRSSVALALPDEWTKLLSASIKLIILSGFRVKGYDFFPSIFRPTTFGLASCGQWQRFKTEKAKRSEYIFQF